MESEEIVRQIPVVIDPFTTGEYSEEGGRNRVI